MSIEVSCAVWKWSRQRGSQLLLLVAIADYANAEGIAWPSVASLSRRTRMSERYVQKMLRQLEEDGEIETVKRTNTSNVYRVRVSDPGAPAPTGGANPGSPLGRTPVHRGGELEFTGGVNPGSPNPSKEPSENPLVISAASIFAAFPKKVRKREALKAIVRTLKTEPHAKLLAAVKLYAEAVAKWPEAERCYIVNPATWFNRGSFDDDPETWTRKTNGNEGHKNGASRALGANSNLAGFAEYEQRMATDGV